MDQLDNCSQYWLPAGLRTTLMSLLITELVVGAFLAALTVVGLSIPLFIQIKNGSTPTSAVQRRRRAEPTYSTYNLYLIYLALFDLAYLLPFLAAYWMNVNQKYNPWVYATVLTPQVFNDKVLTVGQIVVGPYMMANVWLNATIAYQVLILLRQTHQAQRITQPSLTRVNLQGGGVVLGSIVFGLFSYLYTLTFEIGFLLLLFPIIYVIGVAILVKRRGYIPSLNGSTPRDRAIKGLAFYFFRVLMVFFMIWLPWWILSIIGIFILPIKVVSNEEFCVGIGRQLYLFFTRDILLNIQPILTFCMILTKTDVKKYIKDLVALTCIFGDNYSCCSRKDVEKHPIVVGVNEVSGKENTEATDPESSNERRPKTVSILGYTFEDNGGGDENDSNNGSDNSGDNGGSSSIVYGDDNETNKNEVKSGAEGGGNPEYKLRKSREGPPAAGVFVATGEAYRISLRQEDQTEQL